MTGELLDVHPDWPVSGALFDIGPDQACSATFSDDRVYRYELTRRWDYDGPLLAWLMLNPSTADERADDPTIRRCTGFARDWGYGGIVVVNVFALRATDPVALARIEDPIGPDNDEFIHAAAAGRTLICAWGASVPDYWRHRPAAIVAQLRSRGDVAIHHLGLTQGGHPKHPLYLSKDTTPTLWSKS